MSKTSQGTIYRAILECSALKSPAHKLVMLSLLLHVDYGTPGNSHPGHKIIAKETGLSIRKVVYVLHDLEADGFIACTSTKSRKGGKNNFTVYGITLVKLGLIIEDTTPTLNGRIPYARTDQDFSSWQKEESEKQNAPNPSPFIGR